MKDSFREFCVSKQARDISGSQSAVKRLWRESTQLANGSVDKLEQVVGSVFKELDKIFKTLKPSMFSAKHAMHYSNSLNIARKKLVANALLAPLAPLFFGLKQPDGGGVLGTVLSLPSVDDDGMLVTEMYMIFRQIKKDKLKKEWHIVPVLNITAGTKHAIQRFFQRADHNTMVDFLYENYLMSFIQTASFCVNSYNTAKLTSCDIEEWLLPSHKGVWVMKPERDTEHRRAVAVTYIDNKQLFDTQPQPIQPEVIAQLLADMSFFYYKTAMHYLHGKPSVKGADPSVLLYNQHKLIREYAHTSPLFDKNWLVEYNKLSYKEYV